MQAILKIRMLSVRGALLALLAAGLALQSAQAQSSNPSQKSDNKASGSSQAQPASGSSRVAEKESTSANKEHAGGPQEGIKVHGHWVIDVRNPDGKLVTHREFENAYLGGPFLSQILARQNAVGRWFIGAGCLPYTCTIGEPDSSNPIGPGWDLTLSVSGSAFVLKGSFTAPATLVISDFGTSGLLCPLNTPACPIDQSQVTAFTFTHITPSGVSITSGQNVQLTVTITFSAPPA
jgi:hypothetical protein